MRLRGYAVPTARSNDVTSDVVLTALNAAAAAKRTIELSGRGRTTAAQQ